MCKWLVIVICVIIVWKKSCEQDINKDLLHFRSLPEEVARDAFRYCIVDKHLEYSIYKQFQFMDYPRLIRNTHEDTCRAFQFIKTKVIPIVMKYCYDKTPIIPKSFKEPLYDVIGINFTTYIVSILRNPWFDHPLRLYLLYEDFVQ
jgi:hypothetical protein